MTPPEILPIEVVIEAIQFTAGLDPMIIQFAAKDPTHPLLGKSRGITPTQRQIAGAADDADLATLTWGDAECADALVAACAAWGLTVVVVPNVPVPPAEEPEEPTP